MPAVRRDPERPVRREREVAGAVRDLLDAVRVIEIGAVRPRKDLGPIGQDTPVERRLHGVPPGVRGALLHERERVVIDEIAHRIAGKRLTPTRRRQDSQGAVAPVEAADLEGPVCLRERGLDDLAGRGVIEPEHPRPVIVIAREHEPVPAHAEAPAGERGVVRERCGLAGAGQRHGHGRGGGGGGRASRQADEGGHRAEKSFHSQFLLIWHVPF